MTNENLKLLERTVREIDSIVDGVVFVGGITSFLYLTIPLTDIRTTVDVDLIVDANVLEYQKKESLLRKSGFQPDRDVRCRYRKADLIVDLMPTDSKILGFSNKWYAEGIKNTQTKKVGGKNIKFLTLPYFIATKIEAFKGRGVGDYYGSKDIEDIITVIAGRKGAFEELSSTTGNIGDYLRLEFSKMLEKIEFLQTVQGNLPKESLVSFEQFMTNLKMIAG